MTTENFHFYLQNRLFQTGGQLYSDTYPFSVSWAGLARCFVGSEYGYEIDIALMFGTLHKLVD